jgi:hypothetical protein
MEDGTKQDLQKLGLPVDDAQGTLIMRQDTTMSDLAFKISMFPTIEKMGTVVGVFENEPANINAHHDFFPKAVAIFLDTIHSDTTVVPEAGIAWVKDFIQNSSQALAKVVTFNCITQNKYESGKQRSIQFALDMTDMEHISLVGLESPNQGFKVTAKSNTLRALNTFDNFDVKAEGNRLVLTADEIGMYNTTITLFKEKDYKAGFVKTSGESNAETYSILTCQNDF